MNTREFRVPNISCGHCVMTIKRELSELPGIIDVEANAGTKQVTVNWAEPATWEGISSLLREINYSPEE